VRSIKKAEIGKFALLIPVTSRFSKPRLVRIWLRTPPRNFFGTVSLVRRDDVQLHHPVHWPISEPSVAET